MLFRSELREWLATDTSHHVGWRGTDLMLHESIGHASGRWIVEILEKAGRDLSDDDYGQMRRVVGYIRRHLAQEPANIVTSRWRYSLIASNRRAAASSSRMWAARAPSSSNFFSSRMKAWSATSILRP